MLGEPHDPPDIRERIRSFAPVTAAVVASGSELGRLNTPDPLYARDMIRHPYRKDDIHFLSPRRFEKLSELLGRLNSHVLVRRSHVPEIHLIGPRRKMRAIGHPGHLPGHSHSR